jgi:hypothetical protein
MPNQAEGLTVEPLGGTRHRHRDGTVHAHAYQGWHTHEGRGHDDHDHAHSHGLVDPSIKRSREGVRAVGASLVVLAVAAAIQTLIFVPAAASPCSPT